MIPALMPTYNRADLAFERGQGAWLYTADGRRFLDLGAGIATSSLGHDHPQLVAAIAGQAARVMHVSNLYRVPQAERLAARLVAASFADSVFFCNSGAEANEGMVKIIRRAQAHGGHPERSRIICFNGAFHGRTLAMLSATGNPKYLDGFGPVVEGFDHVPMNNMNALRAAITPETAGIMIEPVQGESGVNAADPRFLQELRAACDEFGLFLGMDEVQSGMGRTGRLFAHEWSGVTPDVLSTAKGIAGGFPMGAILATEATAKYLTPGSHATTFGGGPLACAAANAVLDVLLAPGFLDQVQARGTQLAQVLDALVGDFPDLFAQWRGLGLMLGLRCIVPVTLMQEAAMHEGVLTVTAGDNVLRLVPPLVLTEDDCAEAGRRLRRAAERVRAHQAASAENAA
ncbi:aspartate aminotransferase family protein [Gluconacetobacter sacchari]|uniref:Acetylornithine aminotransferase n=2 Tax=Gluconacetobacter sacchari TaxID=92759 RepID=A0A7W4IDJ2_9PROT|nr:aspartate aminotransferase family protein [Gluconacetobacter sacchari]MBB2160777.1 aspartate aminotransferase family protein [Gluconacetobacter sacchari]GBQ29233.1 acetylornithine/succinylornithine aminotransferase [Gluconacetobacter sacchari DSM 12717]